MEFVTKLHYKSQINPVALKIGNIKVDVHFTYINI